MTGRPTDHRNIDLDQFNLDVCFRRAGGKVIWQPRILAYVSDREFDGRGLPAPYTGMTATQLYRELGCSDRLYDFGGCFYSKEDAAVHVTHNNLNDTDYEVIIETPVGKQHAVYRRVKDTSWHEPIKWPISDEQEMKVAAWREERRTWYWNQKRYDELLSEKKGLGAPHAMICRTTIQNLFVSEMGVEEGTYALMDYPDTCQAYFEALNHNQEKQIEVINASPIQLVNFGDNVHASTTSPEFFEKWILPTYQRRCELLHKAGKFVQAHWDGNVKPLLPFAKDTGLDGIEAITPLPQGDVTLEETKAALGDMFLLDGLPAVYFQETYSIDTLKDFTKKCLDLFAGQLVLGISDEMAADGDIERIRVVSEVVDDFNAAI